MLGTLAICEITLLEMSYTLLISKWLLIKMKQRGEAAFLEGQEHRQEEPEAAW